MTRPQVQTVVSSRGTTTKVRFKTAQEFIEEFGLDFRRKVRNDWAPEMDYLFGTELSEVEAIALGRDKTLRLPKISDPLSHWGISPEMVTKLDPNRKGARMMWDGRVEEATVVDETKRTSEKPAEKTSVPALPFSALRHPLMASVDRPYVARYQKEVEIDRKLGLKNQKTEKELLAQDIADLTASNEYYQVTPDILKKMFQFGRLQTICFLLSARNFLVGLVKDVWKNAMMASIWFGLGSWTFVTFISFFRHHPSATGGAAGVLSLLCVGVLAGVSLGIERIVNVFTRSRVKMTQHGSLERKQAVTVRGLHIEWDKIQVDLDLTDLKESSIKIPYNAKLKTLEAQEKNIFKGFTVVRPVLEVSRETYKAELPEVNFNLDPVICGVAQDNKLYLIAWWDIQKDIDKVKANIKMFHKFKVS